MLALNNIRGKYAFLQLHYYFAKNKGAAKNEVLNFISSQPHFTVLKAIQFLVGNLIFIRCAELETARRLTLFVDKVLTVARSAGNFPVIAW